MQHTQVLIENEALDREISALLAAEPAETDTTGLSRPQVDKIISQSQQAEDRTQQIIAHADELRANIEKAREEIARRRAAINEKRAARLAAADGVEARRNRQSEEIERSIRMAKYKWNQVHSVTATSRAFLCGEAAKLYGLRRVRRGSSSEEYKIGGVGIVDLRSMNSEFRLSIPLLHRTDSKYSGQPSTDIDVFVSHRASPDIMHTLSRHPPPSRDHTAAPRLSTTYYISTIIFLQI